MTRVVMITKMTEQAAEANLSLYLDLLHPEPSSPLSQQTREQLLELQKSLEPREGELLRKALAFMNERSIGEASVYSFFSGIRIDSATQQSIIYSDVIISMKV